MSKKKEEIQDTGIIAEFTTNKNGVRVKKCRASCATHTPYDQEGPRRKCTFDDCGKIVRKDDLCGHWTISDMMDGIKVNGHGV